MTPLLIVVSIVLVDLLGFSLVMPLLPLYAKEFGFTPTQIGVLLAAFPLCQLAAAPILGRLSDRYGRRPVLIASQFGTVVSFLILGLTQTYWVMLLARMLDGATGGNILVAQAYVADVTKPEDRAKGLGLIGAAFGIGFVLGPLLGGLIVSLPLGDWRLRAPFLVAAGFSMIAWILVVFWLPESRPTDASGRSSARVLSRRGIRDVIASRWIGLLVAVGALLVLAFSALEGTFSLYLGRRLDWGAQQAAYCFAALGLISALIQGGLIRKLVPKYGEPKLILVGLGALVVGLVSLAIVRTPIGLAGALIAVGIGQGLASPTVSGLISRVTPMGEQGAVFGALYSAQTLARMFNYVVANHLLGTLGEAAPYWEGAAFGLLALALAAWVLRDMPGQRHKEVDEDGFHHREPSEQEEQSGRL
ncbi:tetracycline resistance MFS efflux pump [soil metagenome]